MDRLDQELYIEMIKSKPGITCSEMPFDILEAASFAGGEPDDFMKEFLSVGYVEWLRQTYGSGFRISKERLTNDTIVLWVRACQLYESHLLNIPNLGEDKPFFTEDGLYG